MAQFCQRIRVQKSHSRPPDVSRTNGTSRSIGGPAGPRHPTRKGPAVGPNPVATHGSVREVPNPRPHAHVDPGDPSRHGAVFVAAALGRSLAHRAGCNVCIPMRGNRVDMAAATRRQGSVNSASTLRQLFRARVERQGGAGHRFFRPVGEATRSVGV
jgi:hypothetical protein